MSNLSSNESPVNSTVKFLRSWGDSPVPPTILAALVTSLHIRPIQPLPLLFPPALLFASYINVVGGFKREAAGINASFSFIYLGLALRRKQVGSFGLIRTHINIYVNILLRINGKAFRSKFSAPGIIRGAALVLSAANVVGGGLAYIVDSSPSDYSNGDENNERYTQ